MVKKLSSIYFITLIAFTMEIHCFRKDRKMLKYFIIVMMLSILSYSNNKVISTGKQYLREDVKLTISSYYKNIMCEYKIDKFNNLIFIDGENNNVTLFKIDNEFYYLNDVVYDRMNYDKSYIYWKDKILNLQKEGLYLDGELIMQSNENEEIYLVEYSNQKEKIEIPVTLKTSYITGSGDKDKIKILSNEKELKDIQYSYLYKLMNYLNSFKKCF